MVYLNLVGLILNMIGTTFWFFWGLPQPSFEGGVGIGLEDGNILPDGRTVLQHKRDQMQNKEKHARMAKLGLGFLFVGFGIQVLAIFAK